VSFRSVPFFPAAASRRREEQRLRVTSGVVFRAWRRHARRVGFSDPPSFFLVARNVDAGLPGRHLASKVRLFLQLLEVDRVQIPIGMALTHVPSRVRNVFGDVAAVRALESRILTALEFLMISEAALVTEDAATPRRRAGEPLAQRPHPRALPDCRHRRRRRRCRRDRRHIRVKNVASRDVRRGVSRGRYSRRVYTVAQA